MSRQAGRERGAVAVEFALLLPLFMTIVLGLIDYGWYFYVDQLVVNAAREGARVGAASTTANCSSDGQTAATNFLDSANLKSGTRSITVTCGTACSGITSCTTAVSVVTYPVGSITGFLGGLVPTQAKATATMRQEN